jgi:regulator of replication initiation timing
MSKIQSKYQLGVSNLQSELSATLQRLEEQKDILSSEQLEIERLRLQNEKLALDNANKQRVVEVTKELEQKLAARGFEIRKRMIGKKIVYQAVRR